MTGDAADGGRSFSLRDPWLRLVLALWLGLAVAVAVRTLLRPDDHTIFPLLLEAANHWWQDRPLYADYKPLDYFRYPPVFALALTPFPPLGRGVGGVVWVWLGMAVYAVGLWRLLRDVAPGEWTARRTALFFALGALGGLRGFWNGQSNALVVGLFLLGLSAWVRRRWWSSAWLLAAAVAVKLTPLAPALLLCALTPRRLGPRFVIALLVFAGLPFLTRPSAVVLAHYQDWVGHLTGSARERWPGFRDGWTVWQVLSRLVEGMPGLPPLKQPLDSSGYRLLQLVTAALALLWCLGLQRRRGSLAQRAALSRRHQAVLTLGMGMSWLLLFGPAAEHATYVFLAPVLAWAGTQGERWRPGRPLLFGALLLILILGWGALTEPFQDGAPWLLTALPIGTALFTLWLLAYAASSGHGDRSAAANRLTLAVAK